MSQNKYQLIYDRIVSDIQKGNYKQHDYLPSEHELVEYFQASRETIRKALKLLSEHGFIQKIQGKGSLILDSSKLDFPITGLVSFKELASKLGKESKTKVITLNEQPLIHPLRVKNDSPNEKNWEIIRVREIDGEQIILDKDYLLNKFVPSLTEEICEHSIYEYIEKQLGLTISFAKKEITVEPATAEDRELLDLKHFELMVVVKSHVYLEDASLFQYTESRHRPDKFRFVDFARRLNR
ncbi:GntR family transcriptional regulator [Bacillus sp. TS-2]|nr:GntR family transcriptional regulator [Bacillus sp. TS-2]